MAKRKKPPKKEERFLPPYRVLDLADEKGVFGTKLLADLGADVVKIEPPWGDKVRAKGPFFRDEVHPEKSLYFLFYNTNKRSITLNLELQDGREIFKRLVKTADVVVETFPVGYLDSIGLGYETLAEINPRLVMASITPFGQTGPWRNYKSSDLIAMATSGYMQVTGDPEEPPVRLGDEQSHFAPAQYAAVAIMAALYYRDTVSGRGQYIDVSVQEALITYYMDQHPALCWMLRKENVVRVGTSSALVIPLGAFPCKDRWISAGVATPKEWDTLAQWMYEVTGNEEILNPQYKGGVQERFPHKDIITALFLDFTSRLTMNELFHEGQKRDIIFLPVNEVGDILTDPQLEATDFWVELDHPVVGKLKYPLGIFYGEDIPVCRRAAPLLGQDNEAIYCGELGFSREELAILRSGGII